MHAAGASVLSYLPLIDSIDPKHPIYAIEDTSLGGTDVEVTLHSINAVADAATSLSLPKLRSSSRCVVAGWSYGGVVAVSLAARLQRAGTAVSSLILIDAPLQLASEPKSLRSSYDAAELAATDAELMAGFREAMISGADASNQLMAKGRGATHARAHDHFVRCTRLLEEHVCTERLSGGCEVIDVRPAAAKTSPSCVSLTDGACKRVELADTTHWSLLRGAAAVEIAGLVQGALDGVVSVS